MVMTSGRRISGGGAVACPPVSAPAYGVSPGVVWQAAGQSFSSQATMVSAASTGDRVVVSTVSSAFSGAS